ncbi:MAG: sulfite exporter TauE/SafE family protein [Candidatus Bathyarchaeia archaeon]
MLEWLLPLFGFIISIAAAVTGVGGGIFIVPLLTLLYNFEPVVAIGTSLAVIIITSLASSASYLRQKRVYVRAGLVLACSSSLGGYTGAAITALAAVKMWLGVLFGVFLMFVAFQITYKALRAKSVKASEMIDPAFEEMLLKDLKRMFLGLLLSFFGGFASGLLGIGGGSSLCQLCVIRSVFQFIFRSPHPCL